MDTMKFYLTLKDLDVIQNSYSLDCEEYFMRTGRNVGNLVFRRGLLSIMGNNLSEYKRITLGDLKENPDIYDKATQVVVSCANWLGESKMHERVNLTRTQIFEKFKCPVIPIGIGIQAPTGPEAVQFSENTLNFAKLLHKISPFISVRCQITKLALAHHGIDNVVVTGCPSNFINLNLSADDFRRVNEVKLRSRRVSCLISQATSGNPLTSAFVDRIFSLLKNTPSKYALQIFPLIDMLYNGKSPLPEHYLQNSLIKEKDQIVDFLKDKSVVFSSVPEWMFFSKRFDLCFGMRMHGSMVALQSGVPTVIVYHDSRTKALADLMEIPRISIEDFCSVEQSLICSHMHSIFFNSLDDYFERRKMLGSVFFNFLNKCDLKSGIKFKRFVGA